jgi:hypothetical protein
MVEDVVVSVLENIDEYPVETDLCKIPRVSKLAGKTPIRTNQMPRALQAR